MIRQHELEEKVKFYIYEKDGEFTNHTRPPAGVHTYHPIPLFVNILYTICTNQISVWVCIPIAFQTFLYLKVISRCLF